MVKKVFMLALVLIAASGLMAQSAPKSVTINQSDIQFWTGTGTNSTVIAIGWDDDDASYTPTVVVWGIHWTGNITLLNALDTLMAYDSRFSYTMSGSYLQGLSYNDPSASVNLTPSAGWNCNNYNGVYGSTNLSTSTWLRISESTCDNYNFTGVSNLIYASDPNASSTLPDTVDASLPFSEILYWVGTGTDSAEFIVNFAQPDTAFAWGYLFNGSTTAQAMVDAIAAADPRFWTEGSPSSSGDIHYVTDNGDTLGLTPVDPAMGYNFWWTNLNGVSASSGAASTLHNGDVFKYGDLNSATGWDEMWGFYMEEAWNTIPTPVSVPGSTPGVVNATIAPEDILYWVGEGSNQAIFVVNWADTALAWGYRFASDSVTLQTMMDDIADADPRFSYSGTGMVDDINYTENGTTHGITTGNWWSHLINGYESAGMGQWFHNGDFSRWADPAAGVLVDSVYIPEWNWTSYIYAYPMEIHPVSIPAPVDATIDAGAIEYWVGEGQNEVVFVVNWADTALAWGYRFASDSVTLQTMMDDIAAADPRFSYSGTGMVDDINYTENGTIYGITTGNWWSHLINGYESAGMGQWFHNGDFSRWADPAAGVLVDSVYIPEWNWTSYIYAYPMTIHAVTQPKGYGPFSGIVGTEGCEAIAANDPAILGWATACTVVRGSQNLTNPEAPAVTYGSENDAVGAATTSTMDVVSLGDGGSATLTFAHPIKNGEGPDFAVFENSFDDYFLELAFVEVSSDGERFVRFPATSLTQTVRQLSGNVDATYINNLAGKYRVGYGTPFDLAELADSTGLDIDNITHVRVVDVIGSIDPQYATYDAYGHMVNDPFPTITYSAGFDLDGVAVLHSTHERIDDVVEGGVSLWPNPATDKITVSGAAGAEAVLYDMTGRRMGSWQVASDRWQLDLSAVAPGTYMLRVDASVHRIVKR